MNELLVAEARHPVDISTAIDRTSVAIDRIPSVRARTVVQRTQVRGDDYTARVTCRTTDRGPNRRLSER